MKKPLTLLCLTLATTWLAFAADNDSTPASKMSPLVGTWEHVTPEFRSIKFITPTHFIWIRMNPNSKEIIASLGGRYKHEGDTYTEVLEYGTPEMKDFLGNEIKFNAKLDGDKWHHTGEIPGGFKIDEVWTRLKQDKQEKSGSPKEATKETPK